MLLGQHPKRRAAVPGPVSDGGGIAIVIDFFSGGIVKAVGDDPMMLRIKPGNDGVVVWKGDRWIGRNHAFRCGSAVSCQIEDAVRVVPLGIVVTKAIERNQDDIRLR